MERNLKSVNYEAIKKYINSQKNWITKHYAESQIAIIAGHREWFEDRDVVDIGCGRGILEAAFGPLSKSFRSCDLNDINFFNLKVDVCSAENLPYGDNSFDTVMIISVIEHVPGPEKAIAECLRVIKDEGKLIVAIPHGFAWKLMRLFKFVLPENWVEHARFNEKELMALTKEWKLNWRKRIVPGLFWMYEFQIK
jgi:ubiquinone/menaquinone biosynthesis C-methylase UbiE